jgi:hypothetical protein
MRKLTLDDIRISTWCDNVIAAPLWAYEWRDNSWSPIDELWSDIKQELDRRFVEHCKPTGDRLWRMPSSSQRCQILWGHRARRTKCLACGEEFLGLKVGHGPLACTEKCLEARRKQGHKQNTRPRKHVNHRPRPCQRCGEPFTPKRRDAVSCSRCRRVARPRTVPR